jgi:hypothetical protein
MVKELTLLKISFLMSLWLGALLPNYLFYEGISPLLSNTKGCACLFRT